tara:strand:- start:432 stop:1034 length:603 start_codon:yes stop_codon:yes gene_type:complete
MLSRGAASKLYSSLLKKAPAGGAMHTWLKSLEQQLPTEANHVEPRPQIATTPHRGKWSRPGRDGLPSPLTSPSGSSRGLSTAAGKSPFAQPDPADAPSNGKLSKKEELKQRQSEIAEMMREQTMKEVNRAASSRRPDGVHHVLSTAESDVPSLDEAVKSLVDNKGFGANYDPSKEEWGGPKGEEPTRYGDWEVKGRISDF